MGIRRAFAMTLLLAGIWMGATVARADSPWRRFSLFKKVDADPNTNYPLKRENGPWMIMVASFRNVGEDSRTDGLNADEAADELARRGAQ